MNLIFFVVATTGLVVRAYTKKSLTPFGIFAAVSVACAHATHETSLPFLLLILFYTLGTAATKYKHNLKSHLTLSSTNVTTTTRTHIQVLSNSITAAALTILASKTNSHILLVGVVAHYAAVTADTLSSELGILSPHRPRLITTLRVCPPGTNGAVSLVGLLAGAAGAAIIGVVSTPWMGGGVKLVAFVTAMGVFGSLLDSVLGAVAQESVVDVRTGKVVEAPGGERVLVTPGARRGSFGSEVRSRVGVAKEKSGEAIADTKGAGGEQSRKIVAGWCGVLSNNGVNFVMAVTTAVVGMVVEAGVVGTMKEVMRGVESWGLM